MKAVITTLTLTFSILTMISCSSAAPTKEDRVQNILGIFEEMQKNMAARLQASMKEGGPAAAVQTCSAASPEIEKDHSEKNHGIFRRISDRPRNPAHMADAFELKVLKTWNDSLAKGEKIGPVSEETPDGLRVMKPIMIANPLCLNCHGTPEKLNPAALAVIRKTYPGDKAVGYKEGQLRGAFSAIMK
jgi:hypothetical protein